MGWSDRRPIAAFFVSHNISMNTSLARKLKTGLFCLAAAASSAMAMPAFAQDASDEASFPHLFAGNPIFRDGLTGFQTLDGRGFSMERQGNVTLFHMSGQTEVWALESVPGPRGDEFLKNDNGRIFVRLTDLGGVILYLPSNPHGMPVDPIVEPEPIPEPQYIDNLEDSLLLYLSLRAGHRMNVSIEDIDDSRERWLHDAARIAAETLVGTPEETSALNTLRIVSGERADVNMTGDGELTVFVNPEAEFQGRPSSDSLTVFIKQRIAS